MPRLKSPESCPWLAGESGTVCGVGQPAKVATWLRLTAFLRPSGVMPDTLIPSDDCEPIALPTVGVGQPASIAKSFRFDPCRVSAIARFACPPPVLSLVCGVGHPVRAVSDVRGTDARRRERDSPEGITQGFQVSLYKVEPRVCVFARNLLSKHDCRTALADEVLEVWPEMPLVIHPSACACRAERLTGAASCPYISVIRHACATERERPNTDASKEMALSESGEVARCDIHD